MSYIFNKNFHSWFSCYFPHSLQYTELICNFNVHPVDNSRCVLGDIIKNVTTYEDNPFGPDTEFKGYSYKGAFQVSLDNENNDTENVDKENPETGKNTETEVDDLNSR